MTGGKLGVSNILSLQARGGEHLVIIQDTTADHHHRGGPWAQDERGLLPGAGQERQEPPDWLPG